jgi:hypothetical protein
MTHHSALLVGYCVALAKWLAALWRFPSLWRRRAAACFPHPSCTLRAYQLSAAFSRSISEIPSAPSLVVD